MLLANVALVFLQRMAVTFDPLADDVEPFLKGGKKFKHMTLCFVQDTEIRLVEKDEDVEDAIMAEQQLFVLDRGFLSAPDERIKTAFLSDAGTLSFFEEKKTPQFVEKRLDA